MLPIRHQFATIPLIVLFSACAVPVVAAPVILNPSFENVSAEMATTNSLNNNNGATPAQYAARIDNWTVTLPSGGRFGSITSASEFAPPPAPDGSRVLGLGITETPSNPIYVEQSVSGWDTSKIYVLDLQASGRGGSEAMQVSIGGVEYINQSPTTSGFKLYVTPFFTPAATTNTIRIQTTGSGDKTLYADKLQLREYTSIGSGFVKNSSFELNLRNPTGPGYGFIEGWTTSNITVTGLNVSGNPGANPFADNGAFPATMGDSDDADPNSTTVALIQLSNTLSQAISGLVAGNQYELTYTENTRSGGGGGTQLDLLVTLGGTTIDSLTNIQPVGGSNPYRVHTANFTATAAMFASGDPLLQFATTAVGDRTLLLDNVQITLVPEPSTAVLFLASFIGLAALRRS